MGEIQQHEIPFQERRYRNPRLRRGIFLLPSLFTVANLLCGYYASIAALIGGTENFDHAAKAIGIAIVFDALDGRVARMTGTNTEFGVQFDSIADVVSFGIAPAILAYSWGYRSLSGQGSEAFLGHFAWLCCLAFLICSAWRLARFNVQGMARADRRILSACRHPRRRAWWRRSYTRGTGAGPSRWRSGRTRGSCCYCCWGC